MRWCLLLLPLAAQAAPPRLASTLDLPSWLSFSLEHRTRLEHLDDDPRAPTPSPRTAVSLRTLLAVELTPGPFRAALELADSRAWANDPALLNDRLVNPLEPLNARVGLALENLRLDLGRHTIDLATGDDDHTDGRSTRFDPLFAARRFEFGPTGLWGLLSRSNLVSPGARLSIQPAATVDASVVWRPSWLWSARDVWAATGLRGTNAAPFLGHHLEGRFRWTPADSVFTFDTGLALWLACPFAEATPSARAATSVYGYAQVTVVL
ncbi:MAG: alginate export family protein [Myxococcaceae bacterium]|jgi:hypothetical protein|nr:alginate export family protein [Myxococcaceae bacterium]